MVTFVHSANAPVGENVRTSVDDITPANRRVGQKNLHIGAPLPPGPTPGGGGHGPLHEYVEFHNPARHERRTKLVFDLRGLPPEVEVSFLLTPLRTEGRPADSLFGVAASLKARRGDLPRSPLLPVRWPPRPRGLRPRVWIRWFRDVLRILWCALRNILGRLLGRAAKPCVPEGTPVVQLPRFDPVVHRAEPSSLAGVRGVLFAPFEKVAAYLTIRPTGNLPTGAEYRFDVQQQHSGEEEGAVLGGSTYIVTVSGQAQYPRPLFAPSHDPDTDPEERERIEREAEAERLRVLPPWTHDAVKRARDETPEIENEDDHE